MDFSGEQDADQISLPCQQGNLLTLRVPEGSSCPVSVSARIRGVATPQLSQNRICVHPNTREGTSGALEILIGGKPINIMQSIEEVSRVSRPEDLKVLVARGNPVPQEVAAPLPTPQWVPIGQVSSARMPGQMGMIQRGHEMNALDVVAEQRYLAAGAPAEVGGAPVLTETRDRPEERLVTIEFPNGIGPLPPDGTYDESDYGNTAWQRIAETFNLLFGDWGNVTTNVAGGVISGADLLANPANRQFFREVGLRRFRVWSSSAGNRLFSFAGNNRARELMRSVRIGAPGLAAYNVTAMDVALHGPRMAGIRALASRGGVLGLIFVAAIDIGLWLQQPAAEREMSDLLVDLGVSVGSAIVSTIIGLGITAGLVAGGFLVSGAAVAAVGIAAVVGVGFLVGMAVESTGLRQMLKDFFNGSRFQNAWKSGMTDEEIYQGMMIAP